MTRFLSCALVCVLLLVAAKAALCATFDERLWEKYAGIEASPGLNTGALAAIYLEPQALGDVRGPAPFADLRVVNERKEEVPSQIVARRPEKRQEEIPAVMRNLSRTEKGETWLELGLAKQDVRANAVEVITQDTGFSRQVQVLGSADGEKWNTLREDGVIFDVSQGDRLRHTRITFPQASYRYLSLKIRNGDAQPLTISSVKVLQETDTQGQTYTINGTPEQPQVDKGARESSIVVRMSTIFPLDRLIVHTSDQNFQRSVEVQIKRGSGWEPWAQGTIFSFDAPGMHESQMAIDIPEVATAEFRLVFRNFDSPPLQVTGVTGGGYRRLLVFKQQPDRKLYLFWGNPLAHMPQYDLAPLIEKQQIDLIPTTYLGPTHPNTKFAGSNARLPFTERYKYLLYVVVAAVIAGLMFVQYRVVRRVNGEW